MYLLQANFHLQKSYKREFSTTPSKTSNKHKLCRAILFKFICIWKLNWNEKLNFSSQSKMDSSEKQRPRTIIENYISETQAGLMILVEVC